MPEFDPGEAARLLDIHGVRFIVIGALAAAAAGAPVVTRDLDVTPAHDPENLERLAAALRDLEARLRVPDDPDGVAFPVDAEKLATADSWTLVTSAGPLDVVFRPAGTDGFEDLRRDAAPREIAPGRTVLVASLVDVIRSKEASGREKDRAQLPLLRRTLELVRERERGR